MTTPKNPMAIEMRDQTHRRWVLIQKIGAWKKCIAKGVSKSRHHICGADPTSLVEYLRSLDFDVESEVQKPCETCEKYRRPKECWKVVVEWDDIMAEKMQHETFRRWVEKQKNGRWKACMSIGRYESRHNFHTTKPTPLMKYLLTLGFGVKCITKGSCNWDLVVSWN